jgi:hypothetical protein
MRAVLKLETRNPKFETNSIDQKTQNSKPTRFEFRFFAFRFENFGLFRSAGPLSIFGFRIFSRWRSFGFAQDRPWRDKFCRSRFANHVKGENL